jgi:hypothetical protein
MNTEERSSDGLPVVFGKNRGDGPGGYSLGRLPGRLRESRVDAGKARVCREMHELDAVTAASVWG